MQISDLLGAVVGDVHKPRFRKCFSAWNFWEESGMMDGGIRIVKKDKIKLLFVCMGNICRSPAGEGVMKSMVKDAALSGRIEIDSAGTIGFHAGAPADARMRQAAGRRGYDLASRARQVTRDDLEVFDLILVMDEENRSDMLALAENQEQSGKVVSFCDFCRDHDDGSVPDPYYGGPDGFEKVLDLLEDGCRGILDEVRGKLDE